MALARDGDGVGAGRGRDLGVYGGRRSVDQRGLPLRPSLSLGMAGLRELRVLVPSGGGGGFGHADEECLEGEKEAPRVEIGHCGIL